METSHGVHLIIAGMAMLLVFYGGVFDKLEETVDEMEALIKK